MNAQDVIDYINERLEWLETEEDLNRVKEILRELDILAKLEVENEQTNDND